MEIGTLASRDSREGNAEADHQVHTADTQDGQGPELLGPPAANRHRLPDERPPITHHFAFGGHEGYLTVGLYPNGQPGEILIRMAKEGSTIAGLMECFGTVVSVSLQHGVPLRVLCDKLSHTRFEPSGWTGSAELGYAKSIMDYLFRWLEPRFLSGTQLVLFAAPGNHALLCFFQFQIRAQLAVQVLVAFADLPKLHIKPPDLDQRFV